MSQNPGPHADSAAARIAPSPRAMGMRTHLVLLIFIAVLPLVAFSATMMFLLSRQEHQSMQASLAENAAQLAAGVDYELKRSIAKLEVLGQSSSLASGDLRAFDAMARRIVVADPKWENLMLIGADGEQLVNVRMPFGSRLPKLNRPDLPLRAARSLQPVVSDMAQGVVAQRPLTAIYVPLVQEGAARYVAAAAIEPPNWKQTLYSQLPSGTHALLLDGRGSVITSTGGEELGAAQDGALHDVAAGSSPDIEQTVRALVGPDAYLAYHRSAYSGWSVATFVPAAEFDARVRRSAAIMAGGFGVLIAFGLALALLLGRRTARSISDLVASVKAVAHGGEPLPVRAHLAEVNEAGRALTETAALLAERLRGERAARAEVEAAGRAKNAFLAMLGHELRNPVATIRNAVEIIKHTDASSEPAQRAVGIVDRQSAQITRLVEDLLDLARIEQGKIALRKEIIDLRELLQSVAEDQRAAVDRAGLHLALELPAAAVWVHADRVRIAQVIGNLVHNAAKFTPRGGALRIALAQHGGYAQVRVRDSGAGIDPAALERIFEPFVQAEQDGARAAGGLGLGLALVRTLVDLHGGTVRAASQGKGHGAEFTVTLPTADQAA